MKRIILKQCSCNPIGVLMKDDIRRMAENSVTDLILGKTKSDTWNTLEYTYIDEGGNLTVDRASPIYIAKAYSGYAIERGCNYRLPTPIIEEGDSFD